MTTKIRISEVVFVDLRHTPKSLVDKAATTARQQHASISIEYVCELAGDGSDRASRIEISKILFTKRTDTEGWRKRAGEAIASVRAAKQTFERTLKEMSGFAEFLKDIYGLDPIEGGH